MKNVIVFGYGYEGTIVAKQLYNSSNYVFLGFADNSPFKQGNYSYGYPIRDIEMLKQIDEEIGVSVIIASKAYREIIFQLEKYKINIEGVYMNGEIHRYPFATFDDLNLNEELILYAGDICDDIHYNTKNLFGLSINKWDERHIYHDIRMPYQLPDDCIQRYEAEEVFEYIKREELVGVINEIYRILKPGGYLRICMPDYNTSYIKMRSMIGNDGKIIFDAGGGGGYSQKGVIDGGQVYFATYEDFDEILKLSRFDKVEWLLYQTADGEQIKKYIDLEKGYLNRVNRENQKEDFCLVVDCYK